MNTKSTLSKLMKLAWQFVKFNGLSMSAAMKKAWLNFKLKAKMVKSSVHFSFMKKDGSTRVAIGTLCWNNIPQFITGGNKKSNDNIQVYYDVEKNSFRSFIKANLMSVA